MLTIRLTRKGKKNQPFFKVVVIDKRRSSKGGRAVEILGYVDPLTKKKSFKKERVLHWLKVGAKASPTVHNLLVSEKIIDAKKINKFKKSKKATAQTPVTPAVAPVSTPEAKTQEPVEKLVEAPKGPASAVGRTESASGEMKSAKDSGEAKEEKAPEKVAEPEKSA